jgi:APA family basic amino acid/polyamine antiporter
MTVAGIFILRKKHKDINTSYKVPLYPVTPIIGILGGIYIIISTLITSTGYAVWGIVITLAGLPVYSYMKRRSNT